MWRANSVMKLWQKRITSLSDFPWGQLTTLPPPMGNVVKLFLKTCSKPRNFRAQVDRWVEAQTAFVGPMAELNSMR